jgi:predicted 2-oxoglutarate/Fe(II)-dependent dioxygenase YbiX
MLTKNVVANFITQEDANTLINFIDNSQFASKQFDGRIKISNLPDKVLLKIIKHYQEKTLQEFNNEYKYLSGYVITKYPQGVGMAMHIDSLPNQEMGALIYLNDNYEGGEFVAIDENNIRSEYKPQALDMLYLPSHLKHGVNPVTKGIRYFFTISLDKDLQKKLF